MVDEKPTDTDLGPQPTAEPLTHQLHHPAPTCGHLTTLGCFILDSLQKFRFLLLELSRPEGPRGWLMGALEHEEVLEPGFPELMMAGVSRMSCSFLGVG